MLWVSVEGRAVVLEVGSMEGSVLFCNMLRRDVSVVLHTRLASAHSCLRLMAVEPPTPAATAARAVTTARVLARSSTVELFVDRCCTSTPFGDALSIKV